MLFHNPKGAPSNPHCEIPNGRAVFFQCIVKLAESVLILQCTQGCLETIKVYFRQFGQFESFEKVHKTQQQLRALCIPFIEVKLMLKQIEMYAGFNDCY